MVPALITVGVVLAVGVAVYLFTRRSGGKPAVYENEREEKLANAVARKVGCSPGAASRGRAAGARSFAGPI